MHATLTYTAMPCGRFFTKEGVRGYRFGFNGQMKDDEVYGEGNSYTAEYWQYDPRLGRRWNVDPLFDEFPWQSVYATFNLNPIFNTDPKGLKGDDWFKNQNGEVQWFDNSSQAFSTSNEEGEKNTWFNIGKELLVFNGDRMMYLWQTGSESDGFEVHSKSFNAVSGRPIEKDNKNDEYTFDYSSDRQKEASTGPLPEGLYFILPDLMQTRSLADHVIGAGGRLFGQKIGGWPGGEPSWGKYRFWITPVLSTNTQGRSGFSIHGGWSPGSAGCIDLCKNINDFAMTLKNNREVIPGLADQKQIFLLVNYPFDEVKVNPLKNFVPK